MKKEKILQDIAKSNTLAIIVFKEGEDDSIDTSVYGKIPREDVYCFLKHLVNRMEEETFGDIKDQLPF